MSAVALGSVAQFRHMGGVIGLAVVTNILNSFVKPRLSSLLTADQVDSLSQASAVVDTFEPALRNQIRSIFSSGYNIQMKILIGSAAAQVLAALLVWQKKQTVVWVVQCDW